MMLSRFSILVITFIVALNFFILPFSSAQDSTGTRAESDLTFSYYDQKNDVKLTEKRLENITNKQGFDIKNISTERSGDYLWLNMSMYDFVSESDEIYYRLEAGSVEVLFYNGDGSISYPNGDTDFSVIYTTKMISAELEINRFSLDNLEIFGRVYQAGSDETHGDYVIFDEVAGDANGVEQVLEDVKDDVKISYIYTRLVQDQQGLDIASSELIDLGNNLKVTVTFHGEPESTANVIYRIHLGNAVFEYSGGSGSIKYPDASVSTVPVVKSANSISINFEQQKLEFFDEHLEISTYKESSELKSYSDTHVMELPGYLYAVGEGMDVDITMFADGQLTMTIHGTLNLTNTINLRYLIDQEGDINNQVSDSELSSFVDDLYIEYTAFDFFAFQPYVDSLPGQVTYEVELEDVVGSVNDFSVASVSITSNWKFILAPGNEHEIEFKLITGSTQLFLDLDFVFDVVYDKVTFKILPEFKYWELVLNSTYPPSLGEYVSVSENSIILPVLSYYELENGLELPQFGFTIKYNETLAEQDKPENGDDSDGGFLPGFGGELLVISAVLVILFLILGDGKYRDR